MTSLNCIDKPPTSIDRPAVETCAMRLSPSAVTKRNRLAERLPEALAGMARRVESGPAPRRNSLLFC